MGSRTGTRWPQWAERVDDKSLHYGIALPGTQMVVQGKSERALQGQASEAHQKKSQGMLLIDVWVQRF